MSLVDLLLLSAAPLCWLNVIFKSSTLRETFPRFSCLLVALLNKKKPFIIQGIASQVKNDLSFLLISKIENVHSSDFIWQLEFVIGQ